MSRLGSATLVLALACAGAARAESPRVAFASFEVLGDPGGPELRKLLRAALVGGLERAGLEVVPEAEVARKTAPVPGLSGCATIACLYQLTELLGIKAAVKAHIEVVGSNYVIALELVVPQVERSVTRVDDTCQVCTVDEVRETVAKAGHALGDRFAGKTPGAEQARTLEEKAKAAFAAGRFEEAAHGYEEAYRVSPAPRLLWELARSQERQYGIDRDRTKLSRAREVLRNFVPLAATSAERAEAQALAASIDAELARREAESLTVAPAPGRERTPLARRWQLWLGVGLGAAAIAAIGIAVGVTQSGGSTNFYNTACPTPSCVKVSYLP